MVESIVSEERRVKERMPSYKGLEDYVLDLKMGEYVKSFHLDHQFLDSSCPLQWCFLKCLQGHRDQHRQTCRW